MIGFTRSDEFHLVVTTSMPSDFSQVLKSFRCVVFPEPSGPSNATRNPRFFSWVCSRACSFAFPVLPDVAMVIRLQYYRILEALALNPLRSYARDILHRTEMKHSATAAPS